MNDLESLYKDEDPKYSRYGLRLATIYSEGKRVPKNLAKVFAICSLSTIPECKYLLLKIAYEQQNYADVFYYSQFLNS